MSGETSAVEHEVRVAAAPETVFAYFTDPVKIVRWMGSDATLDPRPGGVCRIAVNAGAVLLGEFVQVDPPWRIVFTAGWENALFSVPPQSTAIEVSFTPDGDGTIVRLRHCRLPADAAPAHREGWRHYLERLPLAVTPAGAGVDPWLDVERAGRAMRDAR